MKSFPEYRHMLFTGGFKLSEFKASQEDKPIGSGIEDMVAACDFMMGFCSKQRRRTVMILQIIDRDTTPV
jgi:hypothetical protein